MQCNIICRWCPLVMSATAALLLPDALTQIYIYIHSQRRKLLLPFCPLRLHGAR